MPGRPLEQKERVHYRDRLRAARYAALADAEGFGEICFAIESLGLRLLGKEATMGGYANGIRELARASSVLSLTAEFPALFTRFDSLYTTIKKARNDAMHTGVYARHATHAAIELCIGLEEALMSPLEDPRVEAADFMVKAPVIVEDWHPVAHARQLMLTHSFSFLPVYIDGRWKLLSELAMARFLHKKVGRKTLLATPIDIAVKDGLELVEAKVIDPSTTISELLEQEGTNSPQTLWLVRDEHDGLSGVLSPFELM